MIPDATYLRRLEGLDDEQLSKTYQRHRNKLNVHRCKDWDKKEFLWEYVNELMTERGLDTPPLTPNMRERVSNMRVRAEEQRAGVSSHSDEPMTPEYLFDPQPGEEPEYSLWLADPENHGYRGWLKQQERERDRGVRPEQTNNYRVLEWGPE